MREATVYLYSGGWAVVVYEKADRDAGTVRFCDVVEKWGPGFDGPGRLILRDGFIDIVKRSYQVTANPGRAENGSDATRRLGLCVGSLGIIARKGAAAAWVHSFPDVLSESWTYQETETRAFPAEGEFPSWLDYSIRRILRVKSEHNGDRKGAA
jgi:hypothetical protein